MVKVNAELSLYDSALAKKPQLVAVNKIDLPRVRARLAEIEDAFTSAGIKACFISAATGEGVPALMDKVAEKLQSLTTGAEFTRVVPKKVFRPQPVDAGVSVRKEGDTFLVMARELERMVAGSDISSLAVRGQLRQRLDRLGLSKALAKAGIKPGDRVRCGELEWEW
jgi:GTP-binding protein